MKKKYSTLQIKTEVKEKLDAFCDARGYKLSGFVEKLIESTIQWTPNDSYTICSVSTDSVSTDGGSVYTIYTGSQFSQSQSYC